MVQITLSISPTSNHQSKLVQLLREGQVGENLLIVHRGIHFAALYLLGV